MNGPTGIPDPNALTQPIPVVPVPPPPMRTTSRAMPQQTSAANLTAGAASLPIASAGGTPPYVHRFGSIPFYLFARFAAFVLDIFGVAFLVATFVYHATDAGYFVVAGHDPNGYATIVALSLGVALVIAFFSEAITGTTLGKLIFALHTRRGNGSHAGAVRVFVRYLLRPIDVLAIGPLLALVTPRHQRLGDFASATVVSRSRIGPFASVLGVLVVAGAIYAQIVFGGGFSSAIGVSAETADYAPALVSRVVSIFGVPSLAPASIVPKTQATDAPASTPAPIPSSAIQ